MKKYSFIIILLISVLLLFSGCGCSHEWLPATCKAPQSCSLCGETTGEALPHQWEEASCIAPKSCPICGTTEGESLPHQWLEASCTAPKSCGECGLTEGEAKEHTYSDWSFGTDTMSHSCIECGQTETEPMDHMLYLTTVLRGRWDCTAVLLFDELAYNVFGPQVPFLEFTENGNVRYFDGGTIYSSTLEFLTLDEYDGKDYYHFNLITEGHEDLEFWYVPEDDSLFSFMLEFERLGEEVEGYLEILTGKWVYDNVALYYDDSLKNLDHSSYSIELFEDGTFTAILDTRIDGTWSIFRDDIIVDDKGTSILLFTLYDGDFYNTTVFMGITEEKTELGITRTKKETVYFTKDIAE